MIFVMICIYVFNDFLGPYFILWFLFIIFWWLVYDDFIIFRFCLEILMKSKEIPRKIMKNDGTQLLFSQKQQISKQKSKKNIK